MDDQANIERIRGLMVELHRKQLAYPGTPFHSPFNDWDVSFLLGVVDGLQGADRRCHHHPGGERCCLEVGHVGACRWANGD